ASKVVVPAKAEAAPRKRLTKNTRMFVIVWLGRADIDISNERGARSMYRTGNILARSKSRNREAPRCVFLNRCSTLRWNGHLRLFMRRRFARGHGERIELRWRVDALRTVEQTFNC